MFFVPEKRFWLRSFRWNLYAKVAVVLLIFLIICYAIILLTVFKNHNSSHSDDNLQTLLIYREEWDGRPPKHVEHLNTDLKIVVIRQTGALFCIEKTNCMEYTQQIQNDDILHNHNDISYHFLIGGDGNIYVGRGWDVRGRFSNKTLDIAFHGNYKFDYPYSDMIRATDLLIAQGVEMHYLKKDYIVICENQTRMHGKSCRHLCGEVRKWKHYNNRTYFNEEHYL